ncbi:unnamed protein product [Hyaloperonospora brassicae]|uniref:Glucosidase 2 subunit beta n=1 Tax=Hyaloperonospora brassicae TaxID=162125 RepID=A0AAV0V4D2_HYABA|nr:unnamed protein product [Hyaloperonospora brassicae]
MLRPVRLVSALGLFVVVVIFVSRSCSASPLHGVAPSDEQKFLGRDFLCVVGGRSEYLPISRVNDDFCDCDAGDDEPGTSACSHVATSAFYCANNGFFAKKIHTSQVHDGVCDCCDGSDEERDGVSVCANACAGAAEAFKNEAKQRLEVVRRGYEKRQATVDGEIDSYFEQLNESQTTIEHDLATLKLLMDRVTVHKEREELRETKYRLEVARRKQEKRSHCGDESVDRSNEQSLDGTVGSDDIGAVEFETLDAVQLADAGMLNDPVEDERALEVLDSSQHIVKSLIELPDGTKVSVADYLRMDHTIQPSTTKWTPRSGEETWREALLGPLINGEAESRRRAGLAVLRLIGLIVSPVRVLVEVLLYSPRVLLRVLSAPDLIDKFSSVPNPFRSAWFRRLGGGSVYNGYSSAMWAAQVVWDTPTYAYHYLFPTLDSDMKLPVAESLRIVLREIQSDIAKLEKDRSDKHETASFDYGPDRAYFALKDKCIEKRIEKYSYKFCAFSDVKQDHTTLGKWDGWAVHDGNEMSPDVAVDYTSMRYTNGHRCYKGPERSVSVSLECGDEDTLLSVDEPSTCVYVMTVRSPLACTAQVLAKAENEVALIKTRH